MSVSHKEVVDAFLKGQEATGSRMFTDGTTIYSFGEHFPIATKLPGGSFLYNTDHYSVTTSKHQGLVNFPSWSMVYECNTEEIKRAIKHPGEPIILTKFKEYTTMDQVFKALRNVVKSMGISKVPIQRWQERIKDDITISAIRHADKTVAGSYLSHLFRFRQKDGVELIIKLTRDEDQAVVEKALSYLMDYMPYLKGKLLKRVDRILKDKMSAPGGLRYVGSINSRYLNKKVSWGSVSILMFRDKEGRLHFTRRKTPGYYNDKRIQRLTSENVNAEDMLIGAVNRGEGTFETTHTIDKELYGMILALMAIKSL